MDLKMKLKSGIYMSVALEPKIPTAILKDDRAKAFFHSQMVMHKDTFMTEILAYSILNSKVFLLLGNRDNNSGCFEDFIDFINSEFSNYYNTTFEQVGTVLKEQNKFVKIKKVKDLIECICFIHNTPIKEGLCNDYTQYPFSSINDYLKGYSMPNIANSYSYATGEAFNINDFINLHNSYNQVKDYDLTLIERSSPVLTENMSWYNEQTAVSAMDLSNQIIDTNRRTRASFDEIFKKLKLPESEKAEILIKVIVKLNLEYKYHFYDATNRLQVFDFTNELVYAIIERIKSLTGYSEQYIKYSLGL